jgi:hypothetical protein
MQNMKSPLSLLAHVHTAVVFRHQAPQENPCGNVRALAIRDLVASKPLQWHDLPCVTVSEKYLAHCLKYGDVVIPSRGDYYKAWLFEGAEEPVLPVGQLNVIRPSSRLDARYLVWYLNRKPAQANISLMLTGTSIKALTRSSLVALEIEVPDLSKQQRIAEIDRTTKRIAAIRHRLTELDEAEIAHRTTQILHDGRTYA